MVFQKFPTWSLVVMAYGPVDRRANRAEWARAQPAAGRAFDGGPTGPKKKYKILKLSV